MSNKILFFGNERLATGLVTPAPTLRALIAAGYDVTGVIVAQNEIGSSRQARELEIVQVAEEHHIPVVSPPKLGEAEDKIRAFQADIGVLVAYGKIVPPPIIDLFPRGIINIHPSLLPRHRGSTPIESAILDGDTETGVSLMQLSSKMDAGPVYGQIKMALHGTETKQALADQLLNLGKDMLLDMLPKILDGTLMPTPQDDTLASYDGLITKEASKLDWHKSALQLEREIKAYAGWPRSRTTINNIDVIVTKAHIVSGVSKPGILWQEPKQLGFYTTDGILVIDSLVPAGKKEMDIASFLAGYMK